MIRASTILGGRTLAIALLTVVGVIILLPAMAGPIALGTKRVELDFEVVDSAAGRPIRGVSVRLYNALDRKFADLDLGQPTDTEPVEATTGADGRVKLRNEFRACGPYLFGRWRPTIFFHHWVVEAKAPGYAPFVASLSDEAPSEEIGVGLSSIPCLDLHRNRGRLLRLPLAGSGQSK